MNFRDQPASCHTRTPFLRALACMLLIGIIYAVTFGSAHSHSDVLSKLDTNRDARAARQISISSEIPLHSHSDSHECLICLFQQQLYNSIVCEPLVIAKPSTQAVFVSAPTFFYHSGPIASSPIGRLSGRAPPFDLG